MKEKHLYICENTTSGIFTGIYDAWEARYGHDNNRILVEEPDNYEFFTKFIYVKTDIEKAEKVKRSIRQKISEEAYIMVYNVSISKEKDKADLIYRFLIAGFAMGKSIMDHLSNQCVNRMSKIDLNVRNERIHFMEFIRFVQMKNNVMFARFRPENDIVISVAEYFADRMQGENWLIYDVNRKKAVVHKANTEWFVIENYDLISEEEMNQLEEQDDLLNLWKCFVDTIAIEERINEKLQLNMLPNRYREFMPEVEYKPKKKK